MYTPLFSGEFSREKAKNAQHGKKRHRVTQRHRKRQSEREKRQRWEALG